MALRAERRRLPSWLLGGMLPFCALLPLCAVRAPAQVSNVLAPASASEEKESFHDPLGRDTPRGTVLGFLSAARAGDYRNAAQYLNVQKSGRHAILLAQQLFVVLDRGLPAHLEQLSNEADRAPPYDGNKNKTLVGTIASENGDVNVLLDHLETEQDGPIWLFSAATLEEIPRLYDEVDAVYPENVLPAFAVGTRVVGIPLFEWLALLLGVPLIYFAAMLFLGLVKSIASGVLRLFGKKKVGNLAFPRQPVRLLLVAFVVRWLLERVHLSLLARQFWSSAANVLIVISCVWLLIFASEVLEARMRRRLRSRNLAASTTLLRLGRRIVDLVIVFVGLIAVLRYFGINATAALAGLGVGGIAIALATQKTLENFIGGISILSDDAVRVGDLLKVGDTLGTVEDISLRSTRIRTLDRTVVNVPNGQLSEMSITTLSSRDKFALNPIFGLRYGARAPEIQQTLFGIHERLAGHPQIEPGSIRVRFLRIGASSLDIEVLAYVRARNLDHFLEIQGALLISIMEAVEAAGTEIALPAQSIFIAPPGDASDRADVAKESVDFGQAEQNAGARTAQTRRSL